MALNQTHITELIRNNYHGKALNKMYDFAIQFAPQHKIKIVTYQTKLNELEKGKTVGYLSKDDYSSQMTGLTMSILKLLDELDSAKTAKPQIMNPPITVSESLKKNINTVFEMLNDYNRQLSFTDDPMEKARIEYKIEKCQQNIKFYLSQLGQDNSHLTTSQLLEKAKEIVEEKQSQMNVNNITVSGGVFQLANTIHNNGMTAKEIEELFNKYIKKG